jgi:mRNA interferase MazF
MPKGDIVLITFPFTDLSGTKLRPAVILIDSLEDITVCFITSQTQWQENNDLLIKPTNSNGLRKTSLIRINKIATLDKSLVKGLLGKLDSLETASLNNSLKLALQI